MPKEPRSKHTKQSSHPSAPSTSGTRPRAARRGAEYKFNFGKHKGRTINEVPWDYILWCTDQGIPNNRPDLKAGIEAFLQAHPVYRGIKSVKQRYEDVRRVLPEWLYKECANALEVFMTMRYEHDFPPDVEEEKIKALEDFIRRGYHREYPARPSPEEKLPDDSLAVIKLRECLSRCPDLNEGSSDEELDHYEDPISGFEHCSLKQSYKKEIVACLKEIEKQHGAGVRALGNWEVRDLIAKRIEGIRYSGGGNNGCEYFELGDASLGWLKEDYSRFV
ncbi:hypothetical protein VNI00_005019 [Paramarasmius palmivorus]|uniref:Uncharacterized protein n=1 Tax=Paramarasmius palmivorus TaxID=297713 RepID=A0AAW0DL85_9AGAR